MTTRVQPIVHLLARLIVARKQTRGGAGAMLPQSTGSAGTGFLDDPHCRGRTALPEPPPALVMVDND